MLRHFTYQPDLHPDLCLLQVDFPPPPMFFCARLCPRNRIWEIRALGNNNTRGGGCGMGKKDLPILAKLRGKDTNEINIICPSIKISDRDRAYLFCRCQAWRKSKRKAMFVSPCNPIWNWTWTHSKIDLSYSPIFNLAFAALQVTVACKVEIFSDATILSPLWFAFHQTRSRSTNFGSIVDHLCTNNQCTKLALCKPSLLTFSQRPRTSRLLSAFGVRLQRPWHQQTSETSLVHGRARMEHPYVPSAWNNHLNDLRAGLDLHLYLNANALEDVAFE